ncbi:MAG: hypothetical protein BWY21_01252 [Parcubacteria group bacterium ADurb.Bin216]|nr:MAG: hypothetical protein BWY21_01252 [Parcubacteria group bacterium ADurb.Bin216]
MSSPSLEGSDSNYAYYCEKVGGGWISAHTGQVSIGRWNYFVGTFDAITGSGKLFIDGVQRGSFEGAKRANTNYLYIARRKDWNDRFFNGQIDDIKTYNRALSSEEVFTLSKSGNVYYSSNGLCGLSHKGIFYSAPSNDLCTYGIPSSISGTGPWAWTCSGTSASVSCSASKGLLGFPKRKPITITASSALTDYQVKMIVPYDSDMQPNFDDLRFATADGTVLPYWIEQKTDSISAIVWVKCNVISGNNTIYMYYGNSSVVVASDGNSTFDFFDGFDGSSLNTSKWAQATAGTYTIDVNDSILTLSTASAGASAHIRSNKGVGHIPVGYIVRARAKTTHFVRNSSPNYKEYVYLIGGGGIYSALFFAYDTTYGKYFASNSGSGWNILGDITGWSANTWHTYELKRNGSTSLIKTVDDSYVQTLTSGIFTNSSYIAIQTGGTDSSAGCSQYYDWILVRKYASSEPTITLGSEECIQ